MKRLLYAVVSYSVSMLSFTPSEGSPALEHELTVAMGSPVDTGEANPIATLSKLRNTPAANRDRIDEVLAQGEDIKTALTQAIVAKRLHWLHTQCENSGEGLQSRQMSIAAFFSYYVIDMQSARDAARAAAGTAVTFMVGSPAKTYLGYVSNSAVSSHAQASHWFAANSAVCGYARGALYWAAWTAAWSATRKAIMQGDFPLVHLLNHYDGSGEAFGKVAYELAELAALLYMYEHGEQFYATAFKAVYAVLDKDGEGPFNLESLEEALLPENTSNLFMGALKTYLDGISDGI